MLFIGNGAKFKEYLALTRFISQVYFDLHKKLEL